MADQSSSQPVDIENAMRLVQSGSATVEEAAARCGLDPAALQARLADTPTSTPSAMKRKSWSRLEVTFWLPY